MTQTSQTKPDFTLPFEAVGFYDFGGESRAEKTVVARFALRSAAEAFIKQNNDAIGADELELFIDGWPVPIALTADEFAETF